MNETTRDGEAPDEKRLLGQLLWRLLELEVYRRAGRALPLEQEAERTALRASLPRTLQQRFDLRLQKGKTPLASSQNGLCGACYISLSRSVVSDVEHGGEAAICEYCGAILAAGREARRNESNCGSAA